MSVKLEATKIYDTERDIHVYSYGKSLHVRKPAPNNTCVNIKRRTVQWKPRSSYARLVVSSNICDSTIMATSHMVGDARKLECQLFDKKICSKPHVPQTCVIS